MIAAVRASDPRFRTVHFSPGFNVVLAIESPGERDSRNGVGKTTLLQVIHFCLGSSPRLATTLTQSAVSDWTFTLDLELAGHPVSVSRTPSRPGVVALDGDFSRWPVTPLFNDDTRQWELPTNEWNSLLGLLMLGLPLVRPRIPLYPTWRSLAMYFMRIGHAAYGTPFKAFSGQSAAQTRVSNAFLLGLNWEYALEWNGLKAKADLAKSVAKAADAGVFGDVIPGIGELNAQRVRLADAASVESERLSGFQVLEQYHEIQTEANALTREMQELTNSGIAEANLIQYYEESLADAASGTGLSVDALFHAALVELPESIVRRLDEVRGFHDALTRNRRTFLTDEVTRLKAGSARRQAELERLALRRSELMRLLQTHGALEEYTALQEMHSGTLAKLAEVDRAIEQTTKIGRAGCALSSRFSIKWRAGI